MVAAGAVDDRAVTLPPELAEAARALRRELHAAPELSHREAATATRLADAVAALGLTPRRVADHGVVADLVGDARGPVVCIRGDIDALPLHEATGVAYASRHPGVMHACGHDVHAAAAWAALAALRDDPPPGVVRVLFQPAEERGDGAARCVADGALDGVHVVLGGHVDLDYPVGTVALQPGPMCASTDHFRLRVRGRGGHGARPHQGIDAVLVAAEIVVALQAIVAREIEPGRPAVVTVGELHAGERYNILAANALLEGTLRAHDDAVRARLRDAVGRVAGGIAAARGAEVEVRLFPGNEPVVNDAELTPVVDAALRERFTTCRLARPNMGGEDFSELCRGRRGVYVRWGAAGPGAAAAPAHSAGFLPDEDVLFVAAAGFAAAARAVIDRMRSAP